MDTLSVLISHRSAKAFPTSSRSCPTKRPSSTTKVPPQLQVWINNLLFNSSRNTVLSGPVNGLQTQVLLLLLPSIAAEPLRPAVCEDPSQRQAGVPNGSDFPHAVAASAAFALCPRDGCYITQFSCLHSSQTDAICPCVPQLHKPGWDQLSDCLFKSSPVPAAQVMHIS